MNISPQEQTAKWAILFPGQGSQYPGMAKVLKENFPWTKELFEEGSEALKQDLLKICLEGTTEELTLTSNAQPCILVTSYAWFQVLSKNLDLKADGGAGHSLGEYSALLASGALSLTDAVRLVRKRGELMQSAVPVGKGKMAAVLGLNDAQVEEICRLATEGGHSLVVPANFNAPSQVVIAGHAEAVERAERMASGSSGNRPDLKARKVIPLKVSAPFHCPLMKKVASDFLPFLEATPWKKPNFPVAHNLDAELRSEGNYPSLLKDQIDHCVKWTDCGKTLESNRFNRFVEVGPGKVLTGLMKRIVSGAKLFSIDSIEELKALETHIKEERS